MTSANEQICIKTHILLILSIKNTHYFIRRCNNYGRNTTIGIIATNVKLTKAQAAKVAGMAHDGLARCIRPIHTTLDGDTLFCMSTEELELPTAPVDVVGILAAKVTEQAVLRTIKTANPQI